MSRVRRDHPRCPSATWICICGHTKDLDIYVLGFIKFRSGVLEPRGSKSAQFAIAMLHNMNVNRKAAPFMLCNLDSIHRADITLYSNKKLSYRRGTARRAMSVKTVLNVAQTFVELHLISPATGE